MYEFRTAAVTFFLSEVYGVSYIAVSESAAGWGHVLPSGFAWLCLRYQERSGPESRDRKLPFVCGALQSVLPLVKLPIEF